MRKTTRLLAATALTLGAMTTAQAGGFQRGTADTDILFEPGNFSTRASITYVNPKRGFESIEGQSGDFGDYTGEYVIPSYAVKYGGDAFACAGHFTESFAAEADYTGSPGGALPAFSQEGTTVSSRTRTIEFDSNEIGATCRVSYTNDMGRFSLLGGLFAEDFNFQGSSFGERDLTNAFDGTQLAGLGALLVGTGSSLFLPTTVSVDTRGDYEGGYRLGLAYERPEIALRVQGIYRSEIEHDSIVGSGTVSVTQDATVRLANGAEVSVPTFLANPGLPLTEIERAQLAGGVAQNTPGQGDVFNVDSRLNTAISPQFFTLNAQTGIAEGTLLLASLRWTDWSTNNVVVNTISNPQLGTSSTIQPYYWRDGWTGSLGVGRAFNENVSGAIAIGYDRGVSTGADTTYTDLYTLSGGMILRKDFAELRFGGLIGYWTDGEQSIDDGAYFDATVGDDWVYGANVAFKLTF